jgi:hypothetical protein
MFFCTGDAVVGDGSLGQKHSVFFGVLIFYEELEKILNVSRKGDSTHLSGDNADVAGFFVTDGVDVVRRALFILFLVRDAKFKKTDKKDLQDGQNGKPGPLREKKRRSVYYKVTDCVPLKLTRHVGLCNQIGRIFREYLPKLSQVPIEEFNLCVDVCFGNKFVFHSNL